MVITKEAKSALDFIKNLSLKNEEIQITAHAGEFEIHYKTIVVRVSDSKDVVEAITAFQTLENLGAEDF